MELRRKLEAHGPRRHPHLRGRGYLFEARAAGGGAMSLTGRFSALFLAALGLVLVGFSTALYVSARIYLDRQVRRAARRGPGDPGRGGRDPSRRRGVGAAGAGPRAGPGVRGRPAALDGPRRPRAAASIVRATWPTRTNSPRSWPAPARSGRPAGWSDRQGGAWRVSRRVLRPERRGPASGTRAAGRAADRRPRPPRVLHPVAGPDRLRPARPDGGDARHAGLVCWPP